MQEKIVEKLKEMSIRYPNSAAYIVDETRISYSELIREAKTNGNILRKLVTGPVIVCGSKEVSMIKAIVACIFAGVTYVPVNYDTPVDRLRRIIELSGAKLIISDRPIAVAGIRSISFDDIPWLIDTCANLGEDIDVKPNELAYIIFTSGSTGVPKGVPISYKNLFNFIKWISDIVPLCDYKNVKVLNQASFSFDLSVADLFYSLCNGHTLVALNKDISKDYAGVLDCIKQVDVAVITPSLLKACLLDKNFNELNFPNLKCVYLCGEIFEKKTAIKMKKVFPKTHVLNAYGPTEATSAVSVIEIQDAMLEESILPVGKIGSFATEIDIINDEIVLKGDSVFSGYLGGIIGGHFIESGIHCYRTGDVGWIDSGKLYCNGRLDNQVKYMGYRIELGEIEAAILSLDKIDDCVVVAEQNDEGVVKKIKAFIIGDAEIEKIKESISSILPGYMIPKNIIKIDSIPLNQNCKADRRALLTLYK